MSENSQNYKCPVCGHISSKTVLITVSDQEYRFCELCYLNFITANVPEVGDMSEGL